MTEEPNEPIKIEPDTFAISIVQRVPFPSSALAK